MAVMDYTEHQRNEIHRITLVDATTRTADRLFWIGLDSNGQYLTRAQALELADEIRLMAQAMDNDEEQKTDYLKLKTGGYASNNDSYAKGWSVWRTADRRYWACSHYTEHFHTQHEHFAMTNDYGDLVPVKR